MNNISYWAWFGTFYLILLAVKDYKNNMKVDDRHNYFMMGVTISLASHIKRPGWAILLIIALSIGLYFLLGATKALGSADIKTISWIFLGYGIINLWWWVWFSIYFIGVVILYSFLKIFLVKYNKPTPFYGVLLIVFSLSAYLYGLYGI